MIINRSFTASAAKPQSGFWKQVTAGITVAIVGVLFVIACQDSTSPSHRLRPGSPAFDDYDNPDSVYMCPRVQCRDITEDELNALYTVKSWIRRNNAPYCNDMYNQLEAALASGRIKHAETFAFVGDNNNTWLGATDFDDYMTYIRSDVFTSLSQLMIPTGHEMLHQGGYGRYPYHQQDMDNHAGICFGDMM